MPAPRNQPKRENFNRNAQLPYELRLQDFEIAMQDVYDLFFDLNSGLLEKDWSVSTTFSDLQSCQALFLTC